MNISEQQRLKVTSKSNQPVPLEELKCGTIVLIHPNEQQFFPVKVLLLVKGLQPTATAYAPGRSCTVFLSIYPPETHWSCYALFRGHPGGNSIPIIDGCFESVIQQPETVNEDKPCPPSPQP